MSAGMAYIVNKEGIIVWRESFNSSWALENGQFKEQLSRVLKGEPLLDNGPGNNYMSSFCYLTDLKLAVGLPQRLKRMWRRMTNLLQLVALTHQKCSRHQEITKLYARNVLLTYCNQNQFIIPFGI